MANCYICGEEIEFINNGFGAIPIHPSGSCGGRGWGGGGSGTYWLRTSETGELFEFPFVTYPSYVNPNARCPVCDAKVFFYQSPYGGRVFFDELGPPWPKHPCTDNPRVKNLFSSVDGRKPYMPEPRSELPAAISDASVGGSENAGTSIKVPWIADGWMPFVVTRIIEKPLGIEAEGKLYLAAGKEFKILRIVQDSMSARFYRQQGPLRIGMDLIQNASKVNRVLNECPVLLKCDPDFSSLAVSSFMLTRSGEVEEIAFSVSGTIITANPPPVP